MCLGPELLLIAGLVTTAAGTGYSAYNQNQAAKQSQKQETLRKQQMALEMRQKQREAIRSAQMAAATANVNSASAGAGYGSGYLGGQSAIRSNLANTQGELTGAFDLGSQMFASNAAEAGYQGQAAIGGAFASFGSMLFSNAGMINQTLGSAPATAAPTEMNPWGANVTVTKPA